MRIRSWELVDIDPRRGVVFVAVVAACFFTLVSVAGFLLAMGPAAILLGLLACCAACYLVSTGPKRLVRLSALRQTTEAPSFAAASNIYLASTSSKSKTLLMLSAEEPRLKSLLAEVRRKVLLGFDARSAVSSASPERRVFSESVKTAVDAVVGAGRARLEEGSDELEGLLSSAGLDDETKLPVFMAVAFFLPIMLMLFAAVAKQTAPVSVGALAVLEVVILDIALGVSGSSVKLRTGGGR